LTLIDVTADTLFACDLLTARSKQTDTVPLPRSNRPLCTTDDISRIGAFEVSAPYHGGAVQRNGERGTVI